MKKIKIKIFLAIIIIVVIFISLDYLEPKEEAIGHIVTDSVSEKGLRLLGIAGMETNDDDFFDGKDQAGANIVLIAVGWDEIDKENEDCTLDDKLKKTQSFYTEHEIPTAIGINPIDTNNIRMPSDIKDLRFNDPIVIKRYNSMIDCVFSQIDVNNIKSFNIGNEIGGSLTDMQLWSDYTEFYKETSAHVKSKNSSILIGTKISYHTVLEYPNEVHEMNKHSDVFMINYYPLAPDFSFRDPSVVKEDFNNIVSVTDLPIYIAEIGYASGFENGIENQKQFVINVFQEWDNHNQIKLINWVWMDDVSPFVKTVFSAYYGVINPNFTEFLGTLGLRYEDGTPKSAWLALISESQARGFNITEKIQ
jgi:hypothetical protein